VRIRRAAAESQLSVQWRARVALHFLGPGKKLLPFPLNLFGIACFAVVPVLALSLRVIFIRAEERALEEKFGDRWRTTSTM